MFADFPEQGNVTQLLQRSLERGRLGHAYLFAGSALGELEDVARTLAKAVNCMDGRAGSLLPCRANSGSDAAPPYRVDSCDQCDSCRRMDHFNHPDVLWVRPESKLRVITIDQMRELMQMVNFKPTIARYKVAIIVAADRLNAQAANAFLKTLEEPPANSILILLTTEPQRMLETVVSRCLRLNFAGETARFTAAQTAWMVPFSETAAKGERGLLARYRLLGLILARLTQEREAIEKVLSQRSPLEQYQEIEPSLREKLEDELAAAIEAEYRRQRTELVAALQWWLRDVWLQTFSAGTEMACFPNLLPAAKTVAQRISSADALENLEHVDRLQRQLHSNVQEALALEVGLLKLRL